MEPTRRPFQYNLRSLFVLTTFVAVMCSIGIYSTWAAPLMIALGIGMCFVGFSRFSFRKHPEAGFGFRIAGLLIKVTGGIIVGEGLRLWFTHAAERVLR